MTVRHTNGQSQEEGQPAEDEHAHYHTEGLGSFLFSGELEQFDGQCAPAGRGSAASALGRRADVSDLLVPAVDPQGELAGVLLTLPHHAGLQVLGGAFGNNINTEVHGQDDGQGDVKGPER